MSTSKSGSKKMSEFELISDKDEFNDLLMEASNTQAFTTIWTPKQENTFQTFVSEINLKNHSIHIKIPEGISPNYLREFLEKNSIEECFFNVKLSKTSLFFKSKYYKLTSTEYIFKVPSQLFKVQRRTDLRFNFIKSDELSVSFPNPANPEQLVVKNVLNISAGGMGIEIDEFEVKYFKPGIKMNDFTFKLKDKVITAEVEVRHVHKLNSKDKFEPKALVGVQFTVLNPTLRQFIGAFVFDETRRLYARYIDRQ